MLNAWHTVALHDNSSTQRVEESSSSYGGVSVDGYIDLACGVGVALPMDDGRGFFTLDGDLGIR